MRKIIQISAIPYGSFDENSGNVAGVWCLCDDNTMWCFIPSINKWQMAEDIPQDKKVEANEQ